jgi:hypothetical protein
VLDEASGVRDFLIGGCGVDGFNLARRRLLGLHHALATGVEREGGLLRALRDLAQLVRGGPFIGARAVGKRVAVGVVRVGARAQRAAADRGDGVGVRGGVGVMANVGFVY